MKPEKAIAMLNTVWQSYIEIEEVAEGIVMAVEALEKQIPKPVQYETDYTWGIEEQQPICPVCDMYLTKIVFLPVEGHEGAPRISYCETCGQAIDWKGGE